MKEYLNQTFLAVASASVHALSTCLYSCSVVCFVLHSPFHHLNPSIEVSTKPWHTTVCLSLLINKAKLQNLLGGYITILPIFQFFFCHFQLLCFLFQLLEWLLKLWVSVTSKMTNLVSHSLRSWTKSNQGLFSASKWEWGHKPLSSRHYKSLSKFKIFTQMQNCCRSNIRAYNTLSNLRNPSA